MSSLNENNPISFPLATFSNKTNLRPRNPVFLGAMSGFTSGQFSIKVAMAGAGAVSLGGFGIDKRTLEASKLMLARGRSEFNIRNLIHYLKPYLDKLKEINVPVFLNIRFIEPNKLEEFLNQLNYSNIIIELNAHCRQPEITTLGIGEEFCNNISLLTEAFQIIPTSQIVSLKIRGKIDKKTLLLVNEFERLGGDILHVDSYIPGEQSISLPIIKEFRKMFNGYLIANNSITAPIALELFNSGINAVSIARRAQNNHIAPYELWQEISSNLKGKSKIN